MQSSCKSVFVQECTIRSFVVSVGGLVKSLGVF